MNVRSLFLSLCLVFGASTTAAAQCFTPDGLDPLATGPCQSAQLQAPSIALQDKALGICWQNCGVGATLQYRATWGKMNPSVGINGVVDCGWCTTRLVLSSGNQARWGGVLNAHYARTWMEQPNSATRLQVWRYLLNGDLRRMAANPGPCGVPACVPANGNVMRVSGYIDYAQDCISGQIYEAWMLTHACDAIDHDPAFPRGGVFHPNEYYTFVGPSAGFAVGVAPQVEAGVSTLESVRRWDTAFGNADCQPEEPLNVANFIPFTTSCLCSAGGGQWYEAQLAGNGVFGTAFSTLPGMNDYKSVAIGTWTNPNVYPGVEELRWSTSTLRWFETCTGAQQIEYFFGATTTGGYPAFVPGTSGLIVPLPPMFVDQSNSKFSTANVSTRNIPFRSDHILNLNL